MLIICLLRTLRQFAHLGGHATVIPRITVGDGPTRCAARRPALIRRALWRQSIRGRRFTPSPNKLTSNVRATAGRGIGLDEGCGGSRDYKIHVYGLRLMTMSDQIHNLYLELPALIKLHHIIRL